MSCASRPTTVRGGAIWRALLAVLALDGHARSAQDDQLARLFACRRDSRWAVTMASADTPGREASRVRDPELSPGQRALLDEFSRKAGAPALDRSFTVSGSPPHRRLVRKDIVIETALSNADLAQLARDGYLEYRPQEDSVAFRAKAYNRQLQVEALPAGRISAKGFRLRRVPPVAFGRHPVLTVIRPFLAVAAITLVVLWAVGVLTFDAASILIAAGTFLAAALVLRIPQ